MKADRHRRFGDLADDIAARLPDREGLVFGASRYTFREVAARIDEAARRLIAAGVRPGEHVALWLNNSDEWIFISFAVQKIGAVLVPINTRFRSRDLAYVLAQSDSSFLITHDRSGPVDYAAMVSEAVSLPASGAAVRDPRYPLLRRVILLGQSPQAGTVDWASLAEPARHVSADHLAACARAVDPAATAFIMYTSGTTGFPKGVVRTHELIRNVEERAFRMAITPNDTILNYLPLFHAFGLSEGAWMSLVTGARQIVTRSFDPEESSRSDRERARDDHPRLRGAHEGPRRGAGGAAARSLEPAHGDLRRRHAERNACRAPRHAGAGAAQEPVRLRHDRDVAGRLPVFARR